MAGKNFVEISLKNFLSRKLGERERERFWKFSCSCLEHQSDDCFPILNLKNFLFRFNDCFLKFTRGATFLTDYLFINILKFDLEVNGGFNQFW